MDKVLFDALCPDCQRLVTIGGEAPEDKESSSFDEADRRGLARMGNAKTDDERKETHKAKFGNDDLPPRGTGRKDKDEK